jgi:hypothetical protein
VVLGMFLLLFHRRVPKSLTDLISKRKELHDREVQAIEAIHAEEIEKREAAIEMYHKTIKAIEEKYDKDMEVLTAKRKNEIKKIIEETNADPELLAKRVSDQMGFEIVYPKD